MSQDPSLERYSRQMRFGGMLEKGQRKLLDSRVTLCGCGALGTVIANALVRAGVGFVRIIDRDFIESHNPPPRRRAKRALARRRACWRRSSVSSPAFRSRSA